MQISQTEEFQKDLKNLQKKYRSLSEDFEILKIVILDNPTGKNVSTHWNVVPGLNVKNENIKVYKVRMMCRSLRKSNFRIIYMYNKNKLELLFIEIYFKGNKEVEDRKRIHDIVKKLQQS